MQLHALFDPHWQKPLKEQAPDGNPPPGLKTYLRRQAYKQLAGALHISEGECHFGKFDETMAARALAILRSDFRVASTP